MGISNQNNALYWATGIDNSGLKNDADQTKKIINDMSGDVAKAGQAAVDSVKNQIESTKNNIKGLETLVAQMRKKMEEAAPGSAKQNAIFDFNEASRSLNNQKAILDKLTTQKNDLIKTQHDQVNANKAEESSQGSLISSLGKWAIGIFSVSAALEIGKKIIASTEGATHAFELVTEQATSGVGYFFKTIASGDWSNFNDGMSKAIKGARDYVAAMEIIQNKTNEQKIKSSSLDIQIGEARADSYSTDPAVVKEALKRIIALQTQKLTEEAALARQNYEVKRKKIADDNGWNEKDLENTIKYYSANKKIIEDGEKFNGFTRQLEQVKQAQKSNPYDDYSAQINRLSAAITVLGPKAAEAGKIAENFSKVTFPQRNEVADLLSKSQDATAAININNRRDKQRLIGIEVQEEAAAAEAAKKAQEEKNKRIKEQLDYTTEIGKKRIANEFEIQQQLLNAETDGAEKQRKQADLDYRKRISDFDIQKAEYIKKYNEINGGIDKKTGKTTDTFLATIPDIIKKQSQAGLIVPAAGTAEDQKQFDALEAAALVVKNAKLTEITKTELDKLKSLYVKYGDERTKIEEEYRDRIQKLAQGGFITEAAELTRERDEKISAVSERLIKETDLYKLATGKQLLISKALTQQLIAESKKQIAAEVAAKNLNPEDASRLIAKLDKADLTVQKTDNPFSDLIDGLAKYKQARDEQSKTNTATDLVDFAILEDAAAKAQRASLDAAAGALQGISSIIRQVSSELTGLTDAEKKTVDEVTNMIDGAATLAMGIATDNPIAIAQGSIELLINVYKLVDVQSQKIEKRIEDDKAAVDKLTAAYDKLGIAISKAYSTNKSKLIADQNQILEDKKKAIEDAKAAEEQKTINAKKLTGSVIGNALYLLAPKTDQKAIDNYNKQLDEINQQIEDNKNAQIEALTGTSIMSAIDEFAQAYVDAWSSGEDAAKKSFEVVKNLIRTALIDNLKGKLQPEIEAIMTSIANAMSDGTISKQEQDAIDVLTNALDAKAAQYKDALDPYLEKNKSGVTGQLQAQLTEGTGSQLVGLWNMTAMDTRIIKEWLLSKGNNGSAPVDISATVVSIQNDTHAISANTLRTANNTDGLIAELEEMKTELKTELSEIKKNTKADKSRW